MGQGVCVRSGREIGGGHRTKSSVLKQTRCHSILTNQAACYPAAFLTHIDRLKMDNRASRRCY